MISRFIMADLAVNSTSALLTCNIFSYCGNIPVCAQEIDGAWPKWLSTVVSAFATAVVATIVVAAVAPAAVCAASFALTYYGVSAATAMSVASFGVAAAGTFAVSGYYSDAIEAVTETNPIRDVVLDGDSYAYESYRMVTDIAGAGIILAATYSPGVCFVAGTLVQTQEGAIPIEEIQLKQLVWAMDPDTGERALKEVVHIFVNKTSELIHVQIGNEVISCTYGHPFYVCDKGWIPAKSLNAGDRLFLLNGDIVQVEAIDFELLDFPVTVFNFEVEDFHSYFVGHASVLVHNTCYTYGTRREAFRESKRKNGIPMSAPFTVGPNYNKHGSVMPGRQYIFRIGPNIYKIIREDSLGHKFADGYYIAPHFNDSSGNHYIWQRR